jgi:hypothetical protein
LFYSIDIEAYTYINTDNRDQYYTTNKRLLERILVKYNEVSNKQPVIIIETDMLTDIDDELQSLLYTIKELGHDKKLALFVIVLHNCPTALINMYRGVHEMYLHRIYVPDFTVPEAKLFLQRRLASNGMQQLEHLIDYMIETVGTREIHLSDCVDAIPLAYRNTDTAVHDDAVIKAAIEQRAENWLSRAQKTGCLVLSVSCKVLYIRALAVT